MAQERETKAWVAISRAGRQSSRQAPMQGAASLQQRAGSLGNKDSPTDSLPVGQACYVYGVSLWGTENALKLDYGGDHTTT